MQAIEKRGLLHTKNSISLSATWKSKMPLSKHHRVKAQKINIEQNKNEVIVRIKSDRNHDYNGPRNNLIITKQIGLNRRSMVLKIESEYFK